MIHIRVSRMNIISVVATVFFAAACGAPKVYSDYATWDLNTDKGIQRSEFVDSYLANNNAKNWQLESGSLNRLKFTERLFHRMDENNMTIAVRTTVETRSSIGTGNPITAASRQSDTFEGTPGPPIVSAAFLLGVFWLQTETESHPHSHLILFAIKYLSHPPGGSKSLQKDFSV